jgi:hypothetical protein
MPTGEGMTGEGTTGSVSTLATPLVVTGTRNGIGTGTLKLEVAMLLRVLGAPCGIATLAFNVDEGAIDPGGEGPDADVITSGSTPGGRGQHLLGNLAWALL